MSCLRAFVALGAVAVLHGLAAPVSADAQMQIERFDPRLDALIPPGAQLERLASGYEWAEGVVWDRVNRAVYFSDTYTNRVYRWKEGEGASVFLEPSGYTGTEPFRGREPGSNGLAIDAQGRLILCQHGDRRIVRREHDGSFTVLAERYQGQRLNSPNDLVIAANGDIYFTDPPYGLPGGFNSTEKELPHNGIYRLSASGELTLLSTELNAPNGIGLSPDGRTLYVANSEPNRPIWLAFPVLDNGNVGESRVFADARDWEGRGFGVPDGLTVDAHGNVWATGPGGVTIFAPDGTRLGRIVTGSATANVTFGGDDGSVLYIAADDSLIRLQTTSRGIGF